MSIFGGVYWVIGIIDSRGAISARVVESGVTHTNEQRLAGRPFRFRINSQDFGEVRHGSERLSPEDVKEVIWWLEREGYKKPDEFFDRDFGWAWTEKYDLTIHQK